MGRAIAKQATEEREWPESFGGFVQYGWMLPFALLELLSVDRRVRTVGQPIRKDG